MPHRRPGRIWAGRAVGGLLLAGLIAYLLVVPDPSGTAAVVTAVAALAALFAPYLLPAPGSSSRPIVERVRAARPRQ